MNLLSLLLGAGNTAGAQGADPLAPLQGDPTPVHPQFQTDSQGYVVPVQQPQSAPPSQSITSPGAPAPNPVQPTSQPSLTPTGSQNIAVTGERPDGWTPHHESLLGKITDAFFGTHIGRRDDQQSLEEALQPLLANPSDRDAAIKTLNRVRQVDPETAIKLYNYVTDNQRQSGTLDRENQLLDFQKQKYVYNQVANMMQVAANRGDQSTWDGMRQQALNYAQSYGMDASGLIPQQFDPNAIETIAMGSVPVKTQLQQAETNRHNMANEGIGQGNLSERTRHDTVGEGQGQQRIGLEAQHNDILSTHFSNQDSQGASRVGQGQERVDLADQKANPTRVTTKYGEGTLSHDGQVVTVRVTSDGFVPGYKKGDVIVWRKRGNQFVPTNPAPAQ